MFVHTASGTCADLEWSTLLPGVMVTSRPSVVKDHICVRVSTTTGVCVDVQVLYCHQRSHRSPGLGLQPEALVVSGGHPDLSG